jgi:hypothetical protein
MWRIRPFHTECPVSGARSGADRLVCCHISNSAGRTIRSRTAMPICAALISAQADVRCVCSGAYRYGTRGDARERAITGVPRDITAAHLR